MRLTRWLEQLRTNVRAAVRQLLSAPGFTMVAASASRSASASTVPSFRWPTPRSCGRCRLARPNGSCQ